MTQPCTLNAIEDSVQINEHLPSAALPKLSPRIGTHPAHSNPAVQAYHQNLTSHLHSLLRSASNSGQPPPVALKPPALVETGRKISDESLSITESSRVGSGSMTGIDGKSTLQSSGITSVIETVSAVIGDPTEARIFDSRLEGEDGEDDEPPQLTARPELNPRRSLTHIPFVEASKPHSSSSSSSSERRHAAASNREAELQQAWKTEGRRVWRTMPDGFTLKMEREGMRSRGGSEVSGKKRSSQHLRADGVGLGIGIAADLGAEREMTGLSIDRTASRGTTTSNLTGATGGSTFSRSPNLPTTSSFIDTAAATAASTRPSRTTSRQEDGPLRDAVSVDEKEEYEAKRLARLERKRGELERRIEKWYKCVSESCTEEDNQEIFLAEIIPTPLSPRNVTKRPSFNLPRLPGLPTSLPFNKPHSFSTKQQPLFIIPPTPDCEKPSSIFETPESAFPKRPASSGVDLTAKLRALEALMGPTPDTIERPEKYVLRDAMQVGDATIRGKRRSGEPKGFHEAELQTPRVGSGGRGPA